MSQQQWGRPAGWNQPAGGYAAPEGFGPSYPPPPGPPVHGAQGWLRPSGGPALGPTPPPKRPNTLKRVLIIIIALVVAALIALIAVNLIDTSSNTSYQNESYKIPPPDKNPPSLPKVPKSKEKAQHQIKQNQLYHQNLPIPVRCDLKPITDAKTDEALQKHLDTLMACLVRTWQPAVSRAGHKIVRPSVTIYGNEITTKCGKAKGGNAFYCPADQQVYYSRTLPEAIPDLKKTRWGPDLVLAHEFGHAVQARSGIMLPAMALEQDAGRKSSPGLEINRRLELQADCLSGQFLRSTSKSLGISEKEVPKMETLFVAIGDDHLTGHSDVAGNHGHSDSRLHWGRQGIDNSDIGRCNTFTAPQNKVD